MKNINISTEYILVYFAKSTNVECVSNLIQKGTLCDINYIFEDQEIEEKLIFYNFTELY